MERVVQFLSRVIKSDESHACFLNSLSYLEYRGARKISRALQTEDIDEEVLSHTIEEYRHSLFFKKMAIKLGGEKYRLYRPDTLLAADAVKRYFFEIDNAVEKLLSDAEVEGSVQKAMYRFTTWLIEERAISLYGHYNQLLKGSGLSISLGPVLSDEAKHLDEVRGVIDRLGLGEKVASHLAALEEKLFWETWVAMEKGLPQ